MHAFCLPGLIDGHAAHVTARYVRRSGDCHCNQGRGHGRYLYLAWRTSDGHVTSKYLGRAPTGRRAHMTPAVMRGEIPYVAGSPNAES